MLTTILGEHENISYTADGVAYSRGFSDIPYCQKIVEICNLSALSAENAKMHRDLAPYFEARFKSLTTLLKQSGVKNILEIASGLGPRDLLLTTDAAVNYMETDLPAMLRQKRILLERLTAWYGIPLPKNLRLDELNVLDEASFERVVAGFPAGRIAIGHEGLFAYFTFEEKARAATIIRKTLLKRGGVWITPDLNTRSDWEAMTDQKGKEVAGKVLERTGRNYVANTFASQDAVRDFFGKLGFASTVRPIGKIAGTIISADGLDPEKVKAQLNVGIWEFRAR